MVTRACVCVLSCHGFTHVDGHVEELQIKADLPSQLPSPSGLQRGPTFAVPSVSDLVKLDILATQACPHLPPLKGGSLSPPGTQHPPSPTV